MQSGSLRKAPRRGFLRRAVESRSSVHIRYTRPEEIHDDSESELPSKRTALRGKRREGSREDTVLSLLRPTRQRRRRQVVADPDDDVSDGDESDSSDSSDSSDDSNGDGLDDDSESSIDSISSGSEDEDSGEESEDEDEHDGNSPGANPQPTRPGFQTLVPAPGNTIPSQPPEGVPQVTESSSSTLSTATTTTSTNSPAQTTGTEEEPLPDSDSASGIADEPASTGVIAGTTSISNESPTDDATSASQVSDGGSGGPRGADVGIVIGTLAIAALLILAGTMLYRRRRRSNKDHLERLPDEKTLPPEPPIFRLSAPPPPRGQRTQSSIMDEAMGAAYQAEHGGPGGGYYAQDNSLSRDFAPVSYEQQNNNNSIPIGLGVGVAPVSPVSPVSPRDNLSPAWTPAKPAPQGQGMRGFNLYPAPHPPPVVPPPPVFVNQNPGGFNRSEPYEFQQPRMSMARTEVTESTEAGTWSTFAVERARANGGKLPLKERVLGHF